MRSYVAVLSLSLLTCAPHYEECHGKFLVDPGFNDAYKQSIHRVEYRWNAFSKKKVSFTDGSADTCTIKPTLTTSELHEELEEESGPWGAIYHRASGNIFMCTDITDDMRIIEVAILHELGHSVWMDHVKGPAIMTIHTSSLDFTEEDHIECWRVHACD